MIAKIKYEAIRDLYLEDAILYLNSIEKWHVKDAVIMDLLNEEMLRKPLIDFYFKDLSPRGVYLFYDEDNHIRYVGQTNQSFYQRIVTHLDTTHSEFSWNSMISIMGSNRCGKPW